MIGPALRVLIVLAVAAANHIALSLPSPEFTIWEKELLKDVRARSPSQQTLWMKSGLCASKVRQALVPPQSTVLTIHELDRSLYGLAQHTSLLDTS